MKSNRVFEMSLFCVSSGHYKNYKHISVARLLDINDPVHCSHFSKMRCSDQATPEGRGASVSTNMYEKTLLLSLQTHLCQNQYLLKGRMSHFLNCVLFWSSLTTFHLPSRSCIIEE